MKIAFVCDVFGQNNNGTSIATNRLIDNMRKRGHFIKVISTADYDQNSVKLKSRNFLMFNNYVRKTNGVDLAKPDKKIILNAIQDCDVVHILMPFKTGQAAAKLCQKIHKPFTTAFHVQPENFSSHIFLQNSRLFNKYLYHRFKRKLYRRAQFIHCPSQFIANNLVKNKYKAEKLVISNGVSQAFKKIEGAAKPDELKDKFCIIFVARYAGEKRHDLLIRAAEQSKYHDKIQIIFAGNGPKAGKIKKMGAKLKNPPITRLFKQDELAATLNYCDLYVHPSDFEIEGISCIEAFTCGLVPVISDSRQSATNQFALTKNNLFKRGDPKDLAQKIDYWIENKQQKDELSAKYLQYSQQFAIDFCMDKMEQMFLDAIDFYTKYYKNCK